MTACVVVMGVTGTGKSTVGKALAARLSVDFIDGDDLHPAENIAKMAGGIPLDDGDRWPWLHRIGAVLATTERSAAGLVVACSALRRSYRDAILSVAPTALFVVLTATPQLVRRRLTARRDHFMPMALIESQFATLEMPTADEPAVVIDSDAPLRAVVERAADAVAILARAGQSRPSA